MTIVDYVFAPVTSTNVLDYLTDLLEEHLILFKELYPNCPIIPKMHYLIHIPDWIKRYIAIAILTWNLIVCGGGGGWRTECTGKIFAYNTHF